jgi:hypothetical protein
MSTEDHTVREALRLLVDERSSTVDLTVPLDLADRVAERHRRRRTAMMMAAALTVTVAGGASAASLGIPRAVSPGSIGLTASPAMLRLGRYTATMTGPGLTIAPPPAGAPVVDEVHAVQIFRASGGREIPGNELVGNVTVGYATVTLAPSLRTGTGSWFVNRPAWVIMYTMDDRVCQATRSTPDGRFPHGQQVFLLDAVNAARAVIYHGSGVCDQDMTSVAVAQAYERISVPWQQIGPRTNTVTVSFDGACANEYGTQLTGQGQLTIEVDRWLTGADCHPEDTTLSIDLNDDGQPLSHGPLGPIEELRTDGLDFTYDAGR